MEKNTKNILIAFILNLVFSIFEFFGGIFTGSVAIISDAVHDIGDAASIGLSYFFEKKSQKEPDDKYTYGYSRYSVIGGLITTSVLFVGSVVVIINAVNRIINPIEINYNGMIIFAVIGVIINLTAALVTRDGKSINRKAVNLHMLEDVLGWIVVLIGAIVMRFTDIRIIDPVLSIAVALFILVNTIKNFKEIVDIFLEKTPDGISVNEIREHLLEIKGVIDVHHVHIRSIDGINVYGTMHVVTDGDNAQIKRKIREELKEHGIVHATLEIEGTDEICNEKSCTVDTQHGSVHHLHHHYHH